MFDVPPILLVHKLVSPNGILATHWLNTDVSVSNLGIAVVCLLLRQRRQKTTMIVTEKKICLFGGGIMLVYSLALT